MKPANVMLTTTGSVRILDFGLARLVTSELTRSNIVVGTMNYMAPEQVRAEADRSPRRHVLRGRAPLRAAERPQGVRGRLVRRDDVQGAAGAAGTARRLGGHALPAELLAIVDRAIEKDREQRYQSMGDMLRDLEQVRAALPPAAPIRMPATRPCAAHGHPPRVPRDVRCPRPRPRSMRRACPCRAGRRRLPGTQDARARTPRATPPLCRANAPALEPPRLRTAQRARAPVVCVGGAGASVTVARRWSARPRSWSSRSR